MSVNALQPVRQEGWSAGFANLLRKEFGLWWSTRRWIKQALVWLAVINGMVFMPSFIMTFDTVARKEHADLLLLGLQVLLSMGVMATGMGALIAMQDAMIGERQSGTAAWVLSKPASRTAFILSKYAAGAVSFVTLAVLLQAVIGYAQIRLWSGRFPAPLAFAAGVGVMALHALFYLALSLMLGTFFAVRGGVIGTGMGVLFGGQIFTGLLKWTPAVTPWKLGDIATSIAMGKAAELPPAWWWALPATAAWTVLFLTIAVWRFRREEL